MAQTTAREPEYDLRVLSLGAGVQSTWMLHLAIDERWPLDAAVFADTGFETRRTYRNRERCRALCAANALPFYTVSNGNIREETLADRRSPSIPFFTKNAAGKRGRLKRACTYEYKIRPIRWKVRELLAERLGTTNVRRVKVEMHIGYTTDEARRAKPSDVKYIDNRFPLIEHGLSRRDCGRLLVARGWEVSKSACICCPFRTGDNWLDMDQDELEQAIDFDETIRARGRMSNCDLTATPFLHSDLRPLRDVLADQDRQLELVEAA